MALFFVSMIAWNISSLANFWEINTKLYVTAILQRASSFSQKKSGNTPLCYPKLRLIHIRMCKTKFSCNYEGIWCKQQLPLKAHDRNVTKNRKNWLSFRKTSHCFFGSYFVKCYLNCAKFSPLSSNIRPTL